MQFLQGGDPDDSDPQDTLGERMLDERAQFRCEEAYLPRGRSANLRYHWPDAALAQQLVERFEVLIEHPAHFGLGLVHPRL